ncbi:hypothetical protein RFI_02373, partial [Reticulomyxa filosa]
KQSKEGIILGEKEVRESQCSYKGKIKEMKDHLDKSCQLISIQQIIALIKELQLQLQTEKVKTVLLLFFCSFIIIFDELKEIHLKSNTEIQQLNKKIDALQHESVKKDKQIIELTNDIQQVKSEKEINEKKQSEEISKMNNDNKILKQQLLKKESQFKNNQTHHHDEDKKEIDSYHQLLQTKSNSPSKFNFDLFRSSSKLINTFTGHTSSVFSIDCSTFDDCQFICSGSADGTVRVWD